MLADEFSSTLLLLHVCNSRELHPCFEKEITCAKKLNGIVQSVQRHAIKTEQLLLEGGVVESILSVAEEKHADLIVMGVHQGDLEDGTRLHGIVSGIMREAKCPVLTLAQSGK